ncbi:30S ribosomal protein S7 [Candidatus Babeliales bacterium]|nr:30S ribosomal protein S7 [Candidatus Babeliales bacterium]
MPRRKKVGLKREVGVDLRFKCPVVEKLINCLMEQGKKSISRSIVYEAFDVVGQRIKGDQKRAYELFDKAMTQLSPSVEVKSRRVGGGVYQIPVEVRPERSLALAMRWLIEAASSRGDKTMGKRLAAELMDAAEGRGNAFKKKVDVIRMAEANRAFSHYAW